MNFKATRPDPRTWLPLAFIAEEPNYGFLVAMYLVHSFIYYEIGKNLMSDEEFDHLASWLFEKREEPTVLNHMHSRLIDWDSLEHNSSGHYIQFPLIVKNCGHRLLNGEFENAL